ncbi:MAG: hypothetical protein ACR2O6_00730 [Ilumatobacteraceae bacterium]
MALLTDPDSLNQGDLTNVADLAFTLSGTGAANRTVITGSATLPALADDEWFEIRNAAIPGNDGLYRVNDGSPTTSSVTCEKMTGVDPVDDTAESTDILGTTGAASEKSVHFDPGARKFYLLEQGNLSADGVTMLAFHSFKKEEWKATDNYLMARAQSFPMTGISFNAGEWVFGQDPNGNNNGWGPADDITAESQRTRKLFRNAGWDEIDANGVTQQKYFCVTTIPTSGAFEDPADQAYYFFGTDNTDAGAPVDFEFAGEVNEAVQYYAEVGDLTGDTPAFGSTSTITRATGSFISDGFVVGGQVAVANSTSNDGTYVLTAVTATTLTVTGTPLTVEAWGTTTIAWDNDNAFTTALRIRDADPEGKTFGEANLTAAGEPNIVSKILRFALSNTTDLKITELDANITNSPYSEVRIRYLAGTYNREVDSTTKRDFGIVIDAGTHSNSNGAAATTSRWDSAAFALGVGEALADYTGGTLIIHEGVNQGSHTINGTPVDNAGTLEVTLVGTPLTVSGSSESFTVQRATPLSVDYADIFEKGQYQLRQASDINENGTIVVVGKTAGRLMEFVGDTLKTGTFTLTNPAGGGSGVIIEGFDTNNTNSLEFTDNGGTARTFPFVAAGTLEFSQNLVDDTDGEYWLWFDYTTRTNLTDGATVGPSGDTMDLESPGSNLPALNVNDYIALSGFANAGNNGLFVVTVVNVSTQDYTVRRYDGAAVGAAESGVTIDVDENPYQSPDAILVDDNGGADIVGAIGATSVAFDFDYDNNVQGGRTAATDAVVRLTAGGLESAQMAISPALTITRNTGLSLPLTAAGERNYQNA